MPGAYEPRLFGGYAFRSESFQQIGLQPNQAGFGGVQRFPPSYGVTLDPELSNLGILALGAGMSIGKSTSFDLVCHSYRLAEPASSLRWARLHSLRQLGAGSLKCLGRLSAIAGRRAAENLALA